MKEKISEKIDQAALAYCENTGLRAAVNAIPYIGGSLDVLFSSKGQQIFQKRILLLLKSLRQDMASLKESSVDQAFLESEEWFDLVVRAMECTVRTRDSRKIELYSRLLCSSVMETERYPHNPEDYLAVLAELTPREVELAWVIYQQQSDRPAKNANPLGWARQKGWDHVAADAGLDEADAVFLLKRLERSGLISEVTGAYFGYQGGVYVITETFRQLMDFLQRGDES